MAALTLFPLQYQRQDSVPLDLDMVFDTTAARTAYLTSPRRYAGQLVTDKETEKTYQLNTARTAWILVGSAGGGGSLAAFDEGIALKRDGLVNWSSASNLPFSAGNWRGAASPTVMVAVTSNSINYARSIDNGQTWVQLTLPVLAGQNFIKYLNGIFFIFSYGTSTILSSTDGITWVTSTLPGASYDWYAIAYGAGKWVIVTGGAGNTSAVSTDGVTWVLGGAFTRTDTACMAYGAGLFVILGFGGYVCTSPDGITWTYTANSIISTNATSISDVIFAAGLFVAVADQSSSGTAAFSSPDGITWTRRTLQNSTSWTSVTYANGLFVAVTNSNLFVNTSLNGTTWNTAPNLVGSYYWTVISNSSAFVAISSFMPTQRNFFTLAQTATEMDFVGPAITATQVGTRVTVTVKVTAIAVPYQQVAWGNIAGNNVTSTPLMKYIQLSADSNFNATESLVWSNPSGTQSGAFRIARSFNGGFCSTKNVFAIDEYLSKTENSSYASTGWNRAMWIEEGFNPTNGTIVPVVNINYLKMPNGSVLTSVVGSVTTGRGLAAPIPTEAVNVSAFVDTVSRIADVGPVSTVETFLTNGATALAATNSFNPALNSLVTGSSYKILIYGVCNSDATGSTGAFRLRMGNNGSLTDVAVLTVLTASTAAGTNVPFVLQLDLTCRVFSASAGTWAYAAHIVSGGVTGITATPIVVSSTGVLNLTSAFMNVSFQSSTAGYNITVHQAISNRVF